MTDKATNQSKPGDANPGALVESSIGDVLRRSKGLNDQQIEQIVMHQRANRMRFGEAAIALNLANSDDVLWALSQQFHYPYAPKDSQTISPELVAATDPFGEQAEVFRDLRSQFIADVFSPTHPRCALAVTSPDAGDGKTFFTANLAVVLSQLGARTLLVDANLRTPRQHELFEIDSGVGLSSILLGREAAHVIHQAPNLPSLYVLPAGTVPPNPLELVQRPAFGLLMHELLTKFDYVVVDTPAAAHGSDCRVIAAKCGAALVMGRRNTTKMAPIEKLAHSLVKGGTKVAGMVVNEY